MKVFQKPATWNQRAVIGGHVFLHCMHVTHQCNDFGMGTGGLKPPDAVSNCDIPLQLCPGLVVKEKHGYWTSILFELTNVLNEIEHGGT